MAELFADESHGQATPGGFRGKRFHTKADLMRCAQAVALAEWNIEPTRPAWDRDGKMVRRMHPGPADLDRLYYLTDEAKRNLSGWAARARRYTSCEREAIGLMQELAKWAIRARATLEK